MKNAEKINEFVSELRKAFKNPKEYFQIEKTNGGVGAKFSFNEKKLEDILQRVSNNYLDNELAALGISGPKIKLCDFSNAVNVIGGKGGKTGSLNPNSLEINLDINGLFKEPITKAYISESAKLKSNFARMINNLCHEHQHYIQKIYSQLVRNGENDKAQELAKLLGNNANDKLAITPDEIANDISHNTTSDYINFMKLVMPDEYESIKRMGHNAAHESSQNHVFGINLLEKDAVREAFYYHRPSEVDARSNSQKQFKAISRDLPIFGGKSEMNAVELWEGFQNRQVVRKQPKEILDMIEKAKKGISVDHFIKLSQKIDNLNLDESTFSYKKEYKSFGEMTDVDFAQNAFVEVLLDKLKNMEKGEAEKFLQELSQKSEAHPFAQKITNEISNDFEELYSKKDDGLNKPRVAPLTSKDYEAEGLVMNPKEQKELVFRDKEKEAQQKANAKEMSVEEIEQMMAMQIKKYDE